MKIYHYGNRCNIAGTKIRFLREKKNLSQEQIAARMQVEGIQLNQKAISRIETGERVLADYELKAFSRILNTPVDTLLDEETQIKE